MTINNARIILLAMFIVVSKADLVSCTVRTGKLVSAPRSGGTGFDPGPRHTQVVNNGTSCSPLGTRIFGVVLGLVAPESV